MKNSHNFMLKNLCIKLRIGTFCPVFLLFMKVTWIMFVNLLGKHDANAWQNVIFRLEPTAIAQLEDGMLGVYFPFFVAVDSVLAFG